MRGFSRGLLALVVFITMPIVMQAGVFTFSWTAGQFKDAINANPTACPTSVCGYYMIAADVADPTLGTNFDVTAVSGPATWSSTVFAGPPEGADWVTTGSASKLLTDVASQNQLSDTDVFSITLSSPLLSAGQRVGFSFVFSGDDTFPIDPTFAKKLQNTVFLSAVPEPSSYAIALGLGFTALFIRMKSRRKIDECGDV